MIGLGDLQGRCTGLASLCFITERSLKPIIERWKSLGIPITAGPAPCTGALGRMTSIYCEDPDGRPRSPNQTSDRRWNSPE